MAGVTYTKMRSMGKARVGTKQVLQECDNSRRAPKGAGDLGFGRRGPLGLGRPWQCVSLPPRMQSLEVSGKGQPLTLEEGRMDICPPRWRSRPWKVEGYFNGLLQISEGKGKGPPSPL